ncbi:MAG TPA: M28 family peptidase [Bryobacteraceae bacterium]
MLKRAFLAWSICLPLFAVEPDAATRRWWSYTQALANDKMQGRDTGSTGYAAAEAYVIQQFQKAGLKPAGVDGFRQPVPMRSARVNTAASPLQLVRNGKVTPLSWYRQITLAVHPDMPAQLQAPLYFVGDATVVDGGKLQGAVAVTLSAPRIRIAGVRRPAALSGAALKSLAATLSIDNLGGPEPPIWPVPYAASVSLSDTSAGLSTQSRLAAPAPAPLAFRFNPDQAEMLFAGSGHTYAELKKLFEAGQPLPNFPLSGALRATLKLDESQIVSDNILAVLPGSDPVLRSEYVVLSAHLDGYGLGEARHGDGIYNGAFDDAAYVALLMDLAQLWHESGTEFKRSLLFCIVTGEEKGLLGSRYFAAHPTIPKSQLAADLNLDQVRPIFPLKTLTTLALKESSLGATVQQVAEPLGIRIQEDPEPERNLLRRSDHYSFMQIGVPAVNFVFGYEKGSPDEKVYRAWYAERYHSPADDLQQPWLPGAAAKFNGFYAALVKAVAEAPDRPRWSPGSNFMPRQ